MRTGIFSCLLVFVVSLGSVRAEGPYAEVVVFGDSLSDTGLSFAGTGIPPGGENNFPYFDGRFSNGPVWIDFLQLGLGLDDEQVLNFAVGGSRSGFGFKAPPSGIFEVPPGTVIPTVGTQIDLYLQDDAPRDNQLFIVWIGSNDLFSQDLPSSVASNIEQHIRALAGAGAEEFLVPNLSPLGETPLVDGTFEGVVLNIYTLLFNRKLSRNLDKLEVELGIKVHRLDTYTLTVLSLIFPDAFGFTDTKNVALSDILAGAITPEEGSTYLYWDVIHPTSLAHQAIGTRALEVLLK